MVNQDDVALLKRAAQALRLPGDHRAYYDRASDTLSLSIGGPPRPAVNVPIDMDDDVISVRVDRARDEVVGIEIEGFLADFVRLHPDTAVTLLRAELRGITLQEIVAAVWAANAQASTASPVARYLEHAAI